MYSHHGHLWCTKFAPCSSYSCLLIHICWNDPRDARMEPPIQVANFLSMAFWDAVTFTLTLVGAAS